MFNDVYFKIFIIVICLSFMNLSCGQEETQVKEIIRPVRYEQTFAQGGNRPRTFSGSAKASKESNLSFKVPGTVQKMMVNVGDNVKAGQLIAELVPQDYKLEKQQAEAALNQAEAQARNAKASYDRTKLLYESNNASLNDLDAARAANESAQAAVDAAKKQLELSNLQLSYTKLKAPTEGAIAAVNSETNENVQAGQTIVQLTSVEGLEVEVTIPEILITQIKEGDPVTVNFDALPDREFAAMVTEVGVASTGMGTTFPVTVLLDNEDADVRSGMAAEVKFNFQSTDQRERYFVPSFAVAEDRQGRYVYVVKDAGDGLGLIERKNVTVGELTAAGLEIFEGLSDGDKVVTAGVTRIQPGQKVKLQ